MDYCNNDLRCLVFSTLTTQLLHFFDAANSLSVSADKTVTRGLESSTRQIIWITRIGISTLLGFYATFGTASNDPAQVSGCQKNENQVYRYKCLRSSHKLSLLKWRKKVTLFFTVELFLTLSCLQIFSISRPRPLPRPKLIFLETNKKYHKKNVDKVNNKADYTQKTDQLPIRYAFPIPGGHPRLPHMITPSGDQTVIVQNSRQLTSHIA